jgi:hypothetical protein
MNDRIDFIAYCIEEFKENEKLTGREVIELFNRYDIISYIKTAYEALHVMGGLAITDDIKSLIAGIRMNQEKTLLSPFEDRTRDTWRDENLLIVCAVEGYAHRHNMTTQETLKLFREYGVTGAIRQCYSTLHTQDIDETVYFAEDYIEARRT